MKNVFKLFGIIALVAVIGFSMAACKDDSDDNSGGGGGGVVGSNPFVGTWTDGELTVTCTATTWTAVMHLYGVWQGTYTFTNNSANFTETNGNNFGTATVSGNIMTVVSTYDKDAFYLIKQ